MASHMSLNINVCMSIFLYMESKTSALTRFPVKRRARFREGAVLLYSDIFKDVM